MFPEEYGIITTVVTALKLHHFDLGNQIKDVNLLAQTTKDGIGRAVRKLNLRKKYEGNGKLTPTFDVKIWKYEIKTQNSELAEQIKKGRAIIAILEKLQKDCAKTADDLNNVLLVIKEKLLKRIEESKAKVEDLKKQAAAAKCSFWEMIFTFGAACRAASKLKNELNSKIGSLKREIAAGEKVDRRFDYFDGLKNLAGTLTKETSELLDVAKDLVTKMEGTKRELEQDFTDDEIDDQLGDIDFANDFAEQLFEAFERLDKQCDITIADTKARKARLIDALT